MTKILNLDASAEACSVALLNGNQMTERYEIAPRQHAKLLLPMVESLLVDSGLHLSQLDAIACNVGPGAFTGIRIAVSVAQGLAYGADLPCISLSSLSNLAAQGFSTNQKERWFCAIDARMNEVYFASFQIKHGIPSKVSDEQVIAPELIDFNALVSSNPLADRTKIGLIGSGWRAYSKQMLSHGLDESLLLDDYFPNAKYGLAEASQKYQQKQLVVAEKLQPTYLRNNVAEKQVG